MNTKTIGLVVFFLAIAGGLVASVKAYIDEKAKYAETQRELALLRADNDTLLAQVDSLIVKVRDDSLFVDSMMVEFARSAERMKLLAADSLAMGRKLTVARAARHQAEELLADLRAAVNELDLAPEVLALLVGERAATDAAIDEAEKCNDLLGNCEQRVGELQGQVSTVKAAADTLQSNLDQAMTNVFDLTAMNARMDTTITDLNDQLKPSFWKSVTSKQFVYGATAGAGLTAIIITIAKALAGG